MQDGLDELSFNLFSGRVAFDISLLAIAAAYSRNLVLLPQDQAALTIITVKTLRDIFIPPLPASFASSVLKCSALAIALYLA